MECSYTAILASIRVTPFCRGRLASLTILRIFVVRVDHLRSIIGSSMLYTAILKAQLRRWTGSSCFGVQGAGLDQAQRPTRDSTLGDGGVESNPPDAGGPLSSMSDNETVRLVLFQHVPAKECMTQVRHTDST